ncbi:MAG: hypothetical protein ORN51_04995 [Akkermansiaceae bacterium]|nr:hypothetical protein [Akkermansiaceae bacterium]
MSAKKRIAPIPKRWISPVVAILKDGDMQKIRWTLTAESEFHLFGFLTKEQAYEYCINLLHSPELHGEMVTGMYDRFDGTLCETWAMLGRHPFNSPVDVYVKIGLHDNQVILNLFSLHIDRTGELRSAISDYQSKKRKK